jgi:spore germination protein GerM
LYSFILYPAIFFRGSLSAFSRIGKEISIKKTSRSINKTKVIIAGSEKEFEDVKKLLNHPTSNKLVLGRIETDHILSNNTIGSFQDLSNVFTFSCGNEIIFCEGQLSFKQIILALQKVPGNVAIKIFANGSHAIIGSDDKDMAGNVIFNEGA